MAMFVARCLCKFTAVVGRSKRKRAFVLLLLDSSCRGVSPTYVNYVNKPRGTKYID
jgi:hypothetical protein